jgi:hypothetical protein
MFEDERELLGRITHNPQIYGGKAIIRVGAHGCAPATRVATRLRAHSGAPLQDPHQQPVTAATQRGAFVIVRNRA